MIQYTQYNRCRGREGVLVSAGVLVNAKYSENIIVIKKMYIDEI